MLSFSISISLKPRKKPFDMPFGNNSGGQGSPPATSALEDQRLEAFSAIKKFAFADKGGVLSENRMIFPLDFFLVLCPLFCGESHSKSRGTRDLVGRSTPHSKRSAVGMG